MPCPELKTCVLATSPDHCSHWMAFQIEERDGFNASARLREDCAIHWLAHFLYDSNVKLLGIQAPVEQTRNVLLDASQKRKQLNNAEPLSALQNGAEGYESHPALGARSPEDEPGAA